MNSLQVKHLSKQYGNSSEYVLNDINLEFASGEFVCVLGNTGCGKTTLLQVISGLEDATEGEVLVDGKSYKGPSKKVMMVFQNSDQLFPWKKLIDNVVYPLISGLKVKEKKDSKKRAEKLLESVGLLEYKNYYPFQLSGGMKQRGVLARALAISPDVMLLDEPFSSLDEITRSRLQRLLLKIHEENKFLAIFVTHSIGEALFLADRIVVMGKQPKSVLRVYENPYRGLHQRDEGYLKLLEEIRSLMGKYPKDIAQEV